MKNKDLRELCRVLLPQLANYVGKGPMVFRAPVSYVLRGFYFESTRFSSSEFYLWIFVVPLYVPTDAVHFSFARRLAPPKSEGKIWMANIRSESFVATLHETMLAQGLPILSKIDDPSSFMRNARALNPNPNDPYFIEAFAYSCILANDVPAATKHFNKLRTVIDGRRPDLAIWQQKLLTRADHVEQMLTDDPSLAIRHLQEIRKSTAENLSISTYLL